MGKQWPAWRFLPYRTQDSKRTGTLPILLLVWAKVVSLGHREVWSRARETPITLVSWVRGYPPMTILGRRNSRGGVAGSLEGAGQCWKPQRK